MPASARTRKPAAKQAAAAPAPDAAQRIAAAQNEIDTIIREVPQEYDPALPIDAVKPHPRNANNGEEELLAASIGVTGFYGAIIVQWATPEGKKRQLIAAGEHRWKDMKRRGATTIRAFKCVLSDADTLRILTADNTITRRGMDDPVMMLGNVDALLGTAEGLLGLAGSGFDEASYNALRAAASSAPPNAENDGSGDGTDEPSRGDLLRLMHITIAEPKHVVGHGDVYQMQREGSPHIHVLVVMDVFADFARYRERVGDDALFCPFPSPFLPLTLAAERSRMVFVQPDAYLAGHLLDKWTEAGGQVAKLQTVREKRAPAAPGRTRGNA